jgi:hypothetical protein
MMSELIRWLLESGEPWTRYRTLVDPLDRPEDDAEVQAARAEMVDPIAGRAPRCTRRGRAGRLRIRRRPRRG